MERILTIAIPTYKRAAKLDQQLAWLDRNLRGLEYACDVIVSDNASPDHTPAICQAWHDRIVARGGTCRINRMPANVGPLPNIARCIELSTSRFTWVIGDDDEIPDEKLEWLVARLEADPELASIVMNFEGVGLSTYARCFSFPKDRVGPGRDVIGDCLRQAYSGLAFMTAQVYRTEYAQAALRAWPQGTCNYDYQIFITAYAGLQGRVLATSHAHMKYVTGDNIYERDKQVGLRLYADSLEVFVQLQRVGYPAALCRWLARRHLWCTKRRFIQRALVNNPLLTLETVGRVTRALVQLRIARRVPQVRGASIA